MKLEISEVLPTLATPWVVWHAHGGALGRLSPLELDVWLRPSGAAQ